MRTLSAALVLVALAFPVSSAHAQSLGDLAKQQVEQRKAVKEDPKVLTNKDVPAVPQSTPAEPAPADPAVSTDAQATPANADAKSGSDSAANGDQNPKDEKYWRGRRKDLDDQLARNQTLLDALQSRVNALSTDFVNRDDPAQRAVIAADRQKAMDEIGRMTKEVAANKQAVTDLEDEAHRANVPAGWLR